MHKLYSEWVHLENKCQCNVYVPGKGVQGMSMFLK